MGDIVLSAGVRQNLLSLQRTAELMSSTQNRLATGKKVNTALDNPNNFFTSAALNGRAGDLNALLDAMSIGIKTLEAADNGLSAITKIVESMQATLRQTRQDKSFKTESYEFGATRVGNISFSGGAVGAIPVDVNAQTTATAATLTAAGGTNLTGDPDLSALTGQTVSIDGAVAYTFTGAVSGQAAALEAAIEAVGGGSIYSGTRTAAGINISRADGQNFTVTTSNAAAATAIGIPSGATSTNGVTAVASVEALVTAINNTAALTDKVRASNDNGKLRIENVSTSDLTVGGITTAGILVGSGGVGAATDTIAGNEVRKNLVSQFNELRDQLDKLADDASYNGTNLLRANKLKLTFNETSTSTMEIQAKDEDGNAISVDAASLGIVSLINSDVDADSSIDTRLNGLADALKQLRSHASNFGANLSIVENRTEFTKRMINTLETGADSLVLADTNEEAANMLALQTRQQLSSTALSLASQADQAVLRLFS